MARCQVLAGAWRSEGGQTSTRRLLGASSVERRVRRGRSGNDFIMVVISDTRC
jgi:hypothetical protein